jgi:hypothetical protein
MTTNTISSLITYLSILQETLKFKKQNPNLHTKYVDVDIQLPDDLVIRECWLGEKAPFSEQQDHYIEMPIADLDKRIKVAKDHLRYLKRRKNGRKYGE